MCRLFQTRGDRAKVATWRLEINKILHTIKVRSVTCALPGSHNSNTEPQTEGTSNKNTGSFGVPKGVVASEKQRTIIDVHESAWDAPGGRTVRLFSSSSQVD